MADDATAQRHSDLALVVARIAVDGEPYWLLRRHAKWGDWSLVGGHVEADEVDDWLHAARREADEELAPLRHGVDFTVESWDAHETSWGPVPSRSVGGTPTTYRVRWFVLAFLGDAAARLAELAADEFQLVPESELLTRDDVSDVPSRLLAALEGNVRSLPFAGHTASSRTAAAT